MAPSRKPKKPDRQVVEADYLAGGCSYQDLADKYGVTKRTIERWGADGNWEERRRQVVAEVSANLPGAVAADKLLDLEAVAAAQLGDLEAYRQALVALLPEVQHKGGVVGPQGWIENYRRLMEAQRLALGLVPHTNESTTSNQKGGTPNAGSGPEADPSALPGAVLLMPGKSTDWAQLATARESGLDTEPGGASSVPGVPG